MPNLIKLFIGWSNYLIYDYLGLTWWEALIVAFVLYLLCFICERILKSMKRSDKKIFKVLTIDLFLRNDVRGGS